MSEKLFREKSLKRVTSPEELNDYVKVANPGIWVLLASVIVLFIGAFVWGTFGQIDSKISTVGVVSNNKMIVYIKENDLDKMSDEVIINVEDAEYELNNINYDPMRVGDNFSEYALHVGNLQKDEWVYESSISCDLEDGVYPVDIVVERINPIKLLFN